MRVCELAHGERIPLVLESESGGLPSPIPKGSEVRLLFPRATEDCLLTTAGGTFPVRAADPTSRTRLEMLRGTNPARIGWVLRVPRRGGGNQLTVQIHRFRSQIRWDEPIEVGIDDLVVERVQALTDRPDLDCAAVCSWLAERLLLTTTPAEGGLPRAIATGSPHRGGNFRLLGRGYAADIEPRGARLALVRVVNLRSGSKGRWRPEHLVEADVRFVDGTIAGETRRAIQLELDQLVAEGGSYFELWRRYEAIERENLHRRARMLGYLAYKAFRIVPETGAWRFDLESETSLVEFRSRLDAAGSEQLEAAATVPAEIFGDGSARRSDEGGSRRRPAVGTFQRVRLGSRPTITLRALDEDSAPLPPKRGCLFAAVRGDQTRLERREKALHKLRSAETKLPQLSQILEGQRPMLRRTDRVKPLSPAVRELFGAEPNPEQRLAIELAINSSDIVVIQGPPGTGKTKVIAAISARLAEIEEKRRGTGGTVLLTSFQHDAVDNAASKAVVFGLPAARFGGRSGQERPGELLAQRWAAQAREQADAALASLPEDRPLALYRSVRDRLAEYAHGRLESSRLRALLDEIAALSPGAIPTTLVEQARQLRVERSATASAVPDVDTWLQVKAVRGLRVTGQSFGDDGPRKARQATQRLGELLSSAERELLEAAATVPPEEGFERLDALARLKESLLDRLTPSTVPGDERPVDAQVLDLLTTILEHLRTRALQGPGGVADALEEYRQSLDLDPKGTQRLLETYAPVWAATCQQSVAHYIVAASAGDPSGHEFDSVIVDEAARANPLDLFIPMALAKRRVVLVGDHRQLPHLLDPDVERALSEAARSKTQQPTESSEVEAGAGEAAAPRGVRGEEEQALKQSLFERLFRGLQDLTANDEPMRVVTLRKQYRMHPVLGGFVSQAFYERYGEGFESPRKPEDFGHRVSGYLSGGRPLCAAWKDIPYGRSAGEVGGRSKSRPQEARWIAREVRRLLVDEDCPESIGVISFYREQVGQILLALVKEGVAWWPEEDQSGVPEVHPKFATLERSDGARVERLRIGTVDAFQGKEFDLVFLSVTRSSRRRAADDRQLRAKYGHLMLANRLCVAMSRQRKLLVAVGDRQLFAADEAREAVPALGQFLDLCGGEDGLVC